MSCIKQWTLRSIFEVSRRQSNPTAAARIIKTLEERIAVLDDPRTLGSALTGDHAGYWHWRIGDYRVVARVEDERVVIIVGRVG